jgi:multiple sugar transport system permease protein
MVTIEPDSMGRPSRFWYSKGKDRLSAALFLFPDAIGIAVFWVVPLGWAIWLSFMKWSGNRKPVFVGFENIIQMFSDHILLRSLSVTLKYSFIFIPIVIFSAMVLASLLQNKRIRGRNVFRGIFFLPYAVSLVIAGSVWAFLFDLKFGLINYLFRLVSLPAVDWIGSKDFALYSIIFVSIWRWLGYYTVIFHTGLQEIPAEYYDSAMIDGSNAAQLFRYITFPLLRPVTLFVVIIALVHSFKIFDQVYVMTAGGPYYATYFFSFYIYERAFRFRNFGYASALSILLIVILLGVALLQIKIFGKGEAK